MFDFARFNRDDMELMKMFTELQTENKFLKQRVADLEKILNLNEKMFLSLTEKLCSALKEQEKSNTEETK